MFITKLKNNVSEKRFPDSLIASTLAAIKWQTLGPILMLKSSKLKSVLFVDVGHSMDNPAVRQNAGTI